MLEHRVSAASVGNSTKITKNVHMCVSFSFGQSNIHHGPSIYCTSFLGYCQQQKDTQLVGLAYTLAKLCCYIGTGLTLSLDKGIVSNTCSKAPLFSWQQEQARKPHDRDMQYVEHKGICCSSHEQKSHHNCLCCCSMGPVEIPCWFRPRSCWPKGKSNSISVGPSLQICLKLRLRHLGGKGGPDFGRSDLPWSMILHDHAHCPACLFSGVAHEMILEPDVILFHTDNLT